MNNCTIKWNTLNVKEWEERFFRIRRSNILQSYDYARAVCPLNHQKARWGLIMIDGKEAGLVQILEAGFMAGLLHAVILDRGPLWFAGFGMQDHIEAFFDVFNREFSRRIGRKRRIIPETPVMECAGYKKLDNPAYKTIWLDITLPEEVLRANLKQKWRNMLNKGEKQGFMVEWSDNTDLFSWLLTNYQEDKAKKGYEGPSALVLAALMKCFSEKGRALTGRVLLDNKAIAGILVFCHGSAATYQIGWTAEEGRKTAAQNFLLWQTVLRLKQRNIFDFDLGGINDESAKSIGKFKEGLGGEVFGCAGQYM